jgi:sulfite reductase (NADPH) flavoprotein alpha-component
MFKNHVMLEQIVQSDRGSLMSKEVLILFGTQSGNSEDLASQLAKSAESHNLVPTVQDMEETSVEQMAQSERILIICSTWGEGEMPDSAEDLWDSISAGDAPKMENTHFSICALGDTSYEFYCQSGKDWDNRLEELGAKRVFPRQDCDVDFDEPYAEWAKGALPAISAVVGKVIPEAVEEVSVKIETTIPENKIKPEKSKEVKTKEKDTKWSMKNPYMTTISEKDILNGPGATKETRHVSILLGDSGLTYRAGDAIGIIPENPEDTVNTLIGLLGFNADQEVESHSGTVTLYDALKKDYEIHRLNKKFVKALPELLSSNSETSIEIQLVKSERENLRSGMNFSWEFENKTKPLPINYPIQSTNNPSAKAEEISKDNDSIEDYIWSRDYVDTMEQFPSLKFDKPEKFLSYLDKLKGRLYSIASSPDAHPGEVQLTIAIVRYNHHNRDRAGLCTGYLADDVDVGETQFGVYMSATKSFLLPEDGDTNIIMVGPGTGIAPFRAFIEQREFDKSSGKNWLFFGDQHEATEYYYKEQIESWLDNGTLFKFTTAWSRDQAEKIYVQNRMLEHAEEIWEWIDGGAYFYVCGDKNYMAKDVHAALIKICSEQGGMGLEKATEFVSQTLMKDEKRYLRDVY